MSEQQPEPTGEVRFRDAVWTFGEDLDEIVIAELQIAADEIERYVDGGAPTTTTLLGWAAVMRSAIVRLLAHGE